jgi:TusA-related sulfurtransferase
MAKAYITRCIVKKNNKQYQKGSVIEGLTADEIKQGLAQNWLEEAGNGKEPEEVKNSATPKREKLLKKAAELEIQVTDEMTDEEIQKSITEAIKKKKAQE